MTQSVYCDEFEQAGKLCKAAQWTDKELGLVINKLCQVIAFLNFRGDCGIIVSKLRIELSSFISMKAAREFDNKKIN